MSAIEENGTTPDGVARLTACSAHRGPIANWGWGVNCSICKGDGTRGSKIVAGNVHKFVLCDNCSGTGRDPIPWSEVFSGWTRR